MRPRVPRVPMASRCPRNTYGMGRVSGVGDAKFRTANLPPHFLHDICVIPCSGRVTRTTVRLLPHWTHTKARSGGDWTSAVTAGVHAGLVFCMRFCSGVVICWLIPR